MGEHRPKLKMMLVLHVVFTMFMVFLGLAVFRESVESMEPADNGDMSYPTQDYVLPDPGMEYLG